MFFSATIKDSTGRRRDVTCEAENESAAIAALRAGGGLVLKIKPLENRDSLPPWWHFQWIYPMTSFDLEIALRQISSMLKSSVTLLEALSATEEQSRNLQSRRVWANVKARILSGMSFSDAMAKDKSHFPEIVVQLTKVGEHSGELDKSLLKGAEHLEAKRNLRSMVINALVYPCMAILMALGVSVFLVVAVIPKIAAFLQSGGATLPPITQFLIDISDWVVKNGMKILIGVAGVVGVWFLARWTKAGREAEDSFLLKIPVSGKILRLSATAIFARTMETMISSGVNLIEALKIAARLMSNERYKRRVLNAHEEIIKGSSFSNALKEAPEFMPMLRRMVSVGESSGSITETLGETARFHEMMMSVLIKRLNVVIEPVIICITGAIVGFVYIAFFTAVFSMANAN